MTESLKKVLLVDDDKVTNMMHERVLVRSGLVGHIDVATDGQAALDYLRNIPEGGLPPELILLDINMPRMDGFEFLREYAALPADQKVRQIIIMLTTSLLETDRDRAEADPNVFKFANKPIRTEHVADMIRDCIDARAI